MVDPALLVFFQRKCASQESCRLPWVQFPCVFSGNLHRALRSDCEFKCDAASCPLIPNIFPRKTCLAGGIPPGSHCHCKCSSFVPRPGRKPNLDKGTLYRRCRVVLLSVPHKPRVALVRKGNVRSCDSHSSKRMSHQKVGMSKVAYHRMLVGGLDVVKRAKR